MKNIFIEKTNGSGPTDGVNVDEFEKLEEVNNLSINVLELTKDKTKTQLHVSTYKNGNEQ